MVRQNFRKDLLWFCFPLLHCLPEGDSPLPVQPPRANGNSSIEQIVSSYEAAGKVPGAKVFVDIESAPV